MFSVKRYTKDMQFKWDSFIFEDSVNGTFLQSMNFLNYHSADKFLDHSLIIEDNNRNIYCVVPGCEKFEDGEKIFFSHRGSTYGGIVINKRYYKSEYVQEMILMIEEYLKKNNFYKIVLKITPDILSFESPALVEYLLTYNKYNSYDELSTYIDLRNVSDKVEDNFNQSKRKKVRRTREQGYEFRELTKDEEVKQFHELLTINLSKYNTKPIHTVNEILEFKNSRLKDIVKFFGVIKEEDILAAGMMFEFDKQKVAHAQNLSTNPFIDYGIANPITFLYYSLIQYYKDELFEKLSWGISTENQGEYLNWGLIKNKESYGSTYSCNKTYFKVLNK